MQLQDLHVMWSGSIIDICDDCDLINVIFQSGHLNKIIARLEMFGPFKNLHWKNSENFITNAIWAIGSFLIHVEKLWKVSDSW